MFERMNESTFDKIHPILEEAFPPTELRVKEGQKALLSESYYRLFGLKDENGAYQGVFGVWDFDDFLYIEHFAIDKAFRNGGFGGKKLDELIEMMGKPTVLEVEVPEDELTRRRVGFYERHGFIFNDMDYLQPPMREGQPFVPLKFMTKPAAIDEKTFLEYKDWIYRFVYKYKEA